ncbi:methyl-accepting chemotaxis protein [Bradyrhizobium sp. CCGB12]|uniref:methyl-accepting chemotaxis protein n=1 Tax=Bradyrhizobium sp. CCGB12 TaxID=2949632 RepID=UPI0020B32A85|nr:methyl-accepting chemotaxis protein [Bradyrhizobium sp. CCGB12]MCP3387794.1 methyl-accepting chemotaxis protein [Bradyrhizobium sp. CCGB12]
MEILQRSKLTTRIVLGFLSIFALMIALTATAVVQVNQINQNLTRMNDVNSVKQRFAINFRGSVHDRAIGLRDVTLVAASETEAVVREIERLAQFYASSAELLDQMFAARDDIDQNERTILASIKATESRAIPLASEIIRKQRAGDGPEARSVLMVARPVFVEWLGRINELIDLEERANREIAEQTRNLAGRFQLLMLCLSAAALFVGASVAWWNIVSIKPLGSLTAIMRKLASGNLDINLPEAKGQNEVSDIIRAVQVFKDNASDADRLRSEQEADAVRKQMEDERRCQLVRESNIFAAKIGRIAESFVKVSQEVSGSANQLSDTAEKATSQVSTVAGAAEQASSNVQTVAAATEELAASISEIGRQVQTSAQVARGAVTQARTTADTVTELTEAAHKVGDVVRLIQEIASQTNLLALNATIEAARAGDMGKGFAVVASEVKALATQTGRATEEIATQIASIQSATGGTVQAIKEIGAVIQQIDEISAAIASAVQQQHIATGDIGRNVTQAATRTADVSGGIATVSQAAETTGHAANALREFASDLSKRADELRLETKEFVALFDAA